MSITGKNNSPTTALDVHGDKSGELMACAEADQKYRALSILWENRKLLWRFLLVFFAFSTAMAFLLPKQYTSTASIMPNDSKSGLGLALLAGSSTGGGGSSSVVSNLLGTKSPTAVSVEILNSRTIADALISRFDLQRVYGNVRLYEARKMLQAKTTITDDSKSGTITISVEDRSPERAAQIAGEYITELNQLVAALDTSSAHRERVFLEDRIAEVRKQLQDSSNKFSSFASKNTALDVPAEARSMVDAATRLKGELIAAQSELEGQQQIYSPENVRVKSSSARVAELKKQLDTLIGNGSSSPDSGTSPSIPDLRQLPALGNEYSDLYRNVMLQESIYEALTKQYELTKVEEAGESPSVKVLDAPDIPEKKSGPKRLLIMALGSLFGALLGIAWILASEGLRKLDVSDPRRLILQQALASASKWPLARRSH